MKLRRWLPSVLLLGGLLAITGGVALFSPPLGLVVLGIMLVFLAYLLTRPD